MTMKKEFNAAEHAANITATRVGGFGSSDAKIFYKIGTSGLSALSNTELQRIAVAMGMAAASDWGGNIYTAAGHKFEDAAAITMPVYEREAYAEAQLAKNFKTFAHYDFSNAGHVVECKYVDKDFDDVAKTYYAQLQYFYLLGAKRVTLLHGRGDVELKSYTADASDIARDEEYIDTLRAGIMILDAAIGDGWRPAMAEKIDYLTTPDSVQKAFDELRAIKAIEADAKTRKEAAVAVIRSYADAFGITGITDSVSGSQVIITNASVTRKFDAAKFLAAHPEFDSDEFYSESKRAGAVSFR